MADSPLQNKESSERPLSETHVVAGKQRLDDVDPNVGERSPRNLHGVKVSRHSHKGNAGRSRQCNSRSPVAHDYYGNSVHNITVQFGYDNRMTKYWSHSTAIQLTNGRKGCQRPT